MRNQDGTLPFWFLIFLYRFRGNLGLEFLELSVNLAGDFLELLF